MSDTVRGFMDESLDPLMASELAHALLKAIEVYGDKPVHMAAWMGETEESNDTAAYVWPYQSGGVSPGDLGPDYFYIHGAAISESTP